ncbi:MAG: antibiotic biosynthesis monooxygenase [Desulfobulbus sp.]|nr:antibiotic biosynthesis monooxygenase [Desulfobulbus sp.]
MIFVLFEVTVKKEGMHRYLTLAAALKKELEQARGFIRSERFQSLTNERKLLSLSVWESEQAVEEWRNTMNHRMSQQQGRKSLFDSYTLTVTTKIRSYTKHDRTEAPQDSEEFFAGSSFD